MQIPDLNLLVTLDVLLAEGSVTRAAARLRLSPSAMSRALARLREVTGDPLLVRAGRALVPTPRAIELRDRVAQLVQDARTVLRPVGALNLGQLRRAFTLRTSEGFVETFAPALIARLAVEAPGVQLRFVQKPDKDSRPLRDGLIDLETGVIEGDTGPELRTQVLFRDRYVGMVRQGHEITAGPMTPERYAAAAHVAVSRDALARGLIDDALARTGVIREVVTVVGGFATAIALARSAGLVATVPERHTEGLRDGLVSFELPMRIAEFSVSLLWHPRMDADPAHRWLRGCVREVCADPRG
ncbi:LysR family transcriptional regulator [Caulobacter sp. 1776]|uniref:LysR family transcriptional regulator n=1 Tax=Caulobacter sp. 1776 TaxID=3156420 RepID=UPI00339391AA